MNAGQNAPVRGVVFDLDGTLVDSMPMVLRAFAHALAPFRPPMTDHDLFLRLGAPPERTFWALLEDSIQVETAMRRLVEFSTENWNLIQPFGGMNRLLSDLHAGSLRLGVWTGRDRKSTECIFREQTLQAWIEATICGDDLPSHKPDPTGLNEVLQRLGVSPSEVLFAGDADVDVLAGHTLGVNTVLIRHGRAVHSDVLRMAWRVVESPEEAYAIIRQTVARFN